MTKTHTSDKPALRHRFRAGKILHGLCSAYITVVDPDTGKGTLVPCRNTEFNPIHYGTKKEY